MPTPSVQAAAEGLPDNPYVDDTKAYRLFCKYLEDRDEGLLEEALDYSTVRLSTIIAKAQALGTYTHEQLQTNWIARALAASLARDVAGMNGKPILRVELPKIEGEREREVAYAYLAWLHMEKRILALQLYPGVREADCFYPGNTLAHHYHLPTSGTPWHDLPMPSTRAASVLQHVGIDLSEAGR